jgi:putative FmdB family regulatory protein
MEAMQRISDKALTQCPSCGAESLTKLVSAAGFRLKGTGWYVTDFRDKGNGAKKSDGKAGGDTPKADGDSKTSTETKTDSAASSTKTTDSSSSTSTPATGTSKAD